MLLLPLVFAAVGLGGLYFTWRYGEGTTSDRVKQSISQEATRRFSSRGCLIPFFLLFVAVGLGLGYFLLYRPLARLVVARSWTALACVVESSTVRSHEGDDSTTYSVDIVYRYEVGGRTYRGNRYDFLGGSSSGYVGEAAGRRRAPGGSDSDLLRRSAGSGLVGATARLERQVPARASRPAVLCRRALRPVVEPRPGAPPGGAAEPLRAALKGAGRRRRFLPGAAQRRPVRWSARSAPSSAAFFWNGITSVFVVQVVAGWRSGHGDVMLTLLTTPFVLIGLALLVAVPHQILAATNPRPRLRERAAAARRD